jgi:dCTP deaminase
MSMLADYQIRRLATHKRMIEPFIDAGEYSRGLSAGLSSAGYDARLGPIFKEMRGGGRIDPLAGAPENAFTTWDLSGQHLYTDDPEPYTLLPGAFVLAHTVETFRMPDDVTADCTGKSTYARCGITIFVTPLEPGWAGQLTLEIANLSPRPVLLHPGRGIAQLRFHRLDGRPDLTYADKGGKYQDQSGVTIARGQEQ